MTARHAYRGAELLLDRPHDWRDQARCIDINFVQVDVLFFTDEMTGHTLETAIAKNICHECPVRRECLDWALDHPVAATFGVWGGLTADERRTLRRAHLAEREYACGECGRTFHAEPRGRPTYCEECRLVMRRRSQQRSSERRRRK